MVIPEVVKNAKEKFKVTKPDTNFWIIAGTLAFLILSYFLYLEYYMPSQESKIISTRFRVLDQQGDNIHAKIESYYSNARQLALKIRQKKEELKDQLENQGYNFSDEQITAYIIKKMSKGYYREFLIKDLEVIDYKLDPGILGKAKWHSFQDTVLSLSETDKYFYFKPIPVVTDRSGNEGTLIDSILVRIKYEDLVRGLARDDVFDGMFIIKAGEFVFSTLNSDMLLANTGLGQGKNEIIQLASDRSSKNTESKETVVTADKPASSDQIISGEVSDITISNEEYKVFLKPVKVEGEYWYLAGLVEKGHFNAASKSISQWVIILLSILLILIILGLPLIKLKVISKKEHLSTGTIINSALAILLGTSIMTLLLLYLTQHSLHYQDADKNLRKLSASVDSSFTSEITDAYRQLTAIDPLFDNLDTINPLFKYDNDMDLDNGLLIIENILNLPEDHFAFPAYYPFADYIFWADIKGDQSAYITPFVVSEREKSKIGHRDYFNRKDEWFLPTDSTKKFRLESILSVTSGNHKLAISTKSQNRDNPVIALTAQFYSLFDPILPKNYGFCIFDENGKVWFHSNKNRNLMENFIMECDDNSNLVAAVYNRASVFLNIRYNNKPHRAYIQPFDKLPLYLVTFYNKDYQTSFQAQVFTMILFFLCTFFLFLFLQVIVLLALERKFQWKLTKNLILKLTRPMLHLNGHYRFLILVYFAVAFATSLLISSLDNIQSFALIYMIEVILFTFSYRVLNNNDLKKNQTKWFIRINLVVLVLMNVIVFFLLGWEQELKMIGYQLLLTISLLIAYQSFNRKPENPANVIDKPFIRNYVLFLLAIAVMFAILPALTFYEIAYNKESEIRLRHYQVDLMKKLEVRNAKWNKIYAPMLDSPASISTLQDRKDKGIYTSFLYDLKIHDKSVKIGKQENDTSHRPVFDSLLLFLRPFYDDEIVENKFLIIGNQKNSLKNWRLAGKDTLVMTYKSSTEDPKAENPESVMITGSLKKLNFLLPSHGKAFSNLKNFVHNLAFWTAIFLVIFFFYHLIKFGIRNIYCLDILANFSRGSFKNLVRQLGFSSKDIFFVNLSQKDLATDLSKNLDVDLSLDWSDKKVIKNSESLINDCHKACLSIQKEKKKEFITIFADHFDWSYTEPDILNQKLAILRKFMNEKEYQFIVRSAIHPEKITTYYEKMIEQGDHANPNGTDAKKMDPVLPSVIINNLQAVMKNIMIKHLPLNCSSAKKEGDDGCGVKARKLSLQELIDKELKASEYLGRFKEAMDYYYKKEIRDRKLEYPEKLIINKINILAENYYEDLLGACSDEEKYVLFDLADDMIVNRKNARTIFSLLEKGIIIKKCDRINFMNFSFHHFLISKMNKDETSALEIKFGKGSGSWQGYRITLVMIIVSLFVFIAMANHDFIDNLNRLFVVIAGAITSITTVLGFLSRAGKTVSD